jgi:tetratricopeptide (TPR) repeat protein
LSWNYLQRARSFIKGGKQQQAIYDLNQAIRLSPNNKNLYNVRAKLYFNLGQTKEALEDLNQIKNMSGTNYSFSDNEDDLFRIKKTGLLSLLDYLKWVIYKSRS